MTLQIGLTCTLQSYFSHSKISKKIVDLTKCGKIIKNKHKNGNGLHELGNGLHGLGNGLHGLGNGLHGLGNGLHGLGNRLHGLGNGLHGLGIMGLMGR